MLPVLLSFGPLKIYTFGVFLTLAFFWGSFLLWKNIRLSSFKEETVFNGLFLSLAGGLFVSRLLYVILHFNKFGFDLLKFILINGYPGLSLYGFLAGGLGSYYLFCLSKKMKFEEFSTYFTSSIFLALGFGKLGSFFAAEEAGSKTKFILSIKYFGYEGLRHLTPLYESILFFLGAFISYKLLFEIRRQNYPQGFNLYFLIWYFALVYTLAEPLKQREKLLFDLSLNGLLSILLLLTFSFYFLYYFRDLIFKFAQYGKKTNKKQS